MAGISFTTKNVTANRAVGEFKVGGKDVDLTIGIPKQRPGESVEDAFRRALEEVRDGLTGILKDPNGVDVSLR